MGEAILLFFCVGAVQSWWAVSGFTHLLGSAIQTSPFFFLWLFVISLAQMQVLHVGACWSVYITSYAYKGVFSIEEGRKDIALSKAETGRVEQYQNSNETPLILRLKVLFDFFLYL